MGFRPFIYSLANRHGLNGFVLFDAVSSLLGICYKVNYEGQASMELEMAIRPICHSERSEESYIYIRKEGAVFIIEPKEIIVGIIKDLKKAIPVGVISFKFRNTNVELIVDICKRIYKKTNLNKVALSGGVFQNMFLLQSTVKKLQEESFTVYTHSKVPPNDGGISLGQTVIASFRVKELRVMCLGIPVRIVEKKNGIGIGEIGGVKRCGYRGLCNFACRICYSEVG